MPNDDYDEDYDDDYENDDLEREDDISHGEIADPVELVKKILPVELFEKFEIYSYRGAASILSSSLPDQYNQILEVLRKFQISKDMIRKPGGNKGLIPQYVDTLFGGDWQEARITADLHVKILEAKGKNPGTIKEYTREGFLDGHRIDFVNGKVALDLEWNSKDQTYDRDLYAFSAFYEAGAIDVGVLITRGTALDNDFLRTLGNVLKKQVVDTPTGKETIFVEGDSPVYKKFGASTTGMGKLLYRLDAGRNGGCPVLVIGITPKCIV